MSNDLLIIKALADRIEDDPKNAAWFLVCAYKLGKGCQVNEALEMPPTETKPTLRVVKNEQ
jgi:hypothetical protein